MASRWSATALGGIALLALAAGALLPVNAYLAGVALVFLLAAVALGATAQMQKPFAGLALMVAMAVAFPFEFRGPSAVMMGSTLPLAAGFCGVWLVRIAIRGEADLDRSRMVYAVLALMAVATVAFAFGQYPWFPYEPAPLPAQVAQLALFLVSGCLLLAIGHQLDDIAQLKWLTWILVATGLFTVVMQSVPSLNFIARLTSRPGSVGSQFWTWLVAVTVAQALVNRSLTVAVRLALLGIAAFALWHGLFQVRSWASGWAPPLVAVGAIVFIRFPRVTVASSIVVVPLGLMAMNYLPSSALMGDEEYSLLTRQEAWRVLWQLVERSPIIGTGPANYYYYTENFPILGWYVRFISHNNYQDLLVQTGLLGLLTFCWFAGEALWLAFQLGRRAPAGFANAYAVAVFGGLAGSLASGMLGDWIIPFYYNAGVMSFRSSVLFWVFLGGLLALKRMLARSAEAEVATTRRVKTFHNRGAMLPVH